MTDCEYFAVDLDQLVRPFDTAPTDYDATVARSIASPLLRRLLHTAVGLSHDSIDLLSTMSDRLRAVEGIVIRDPLDS
ncbi:hypothetical protein [Nocardia iowensis]|uniref:Uncharacterized protein n=1 Tax=Nocardia iowensis TaxID=204891 RepID=A0ABX8RLP1_NOCIO|nr:hypothetical protein [Nocardia iowensis]QXN90221.1 hypothetical protein KV110_33125 [Nocardia iowensis]